MERIKIVFIGAGSASFGRANIANIVSSQKLKDKEVLVSLVDIDEVALDRTYRFAQILKQYYKSKVNFEATTERKKALPQANYVITAVARKRMELWKQDFYIPLSYGFKQVYGENGGPGAAFHTLRSIHLILPIARDMEDLCPNALLINYSNPESRVCLAVNKLTNIRVIGLCHGAFGTLRAVAEILGREEKDIDITIGGINHFHWVLKIEDKNTGKDLYPQFHKRMERMKGEVRVKGVSGGPLTYLMYKKFGLFPLPADNHIGEYVSFGYEVTGPHWLYERRAPGWDTTSDPFIHKIQEVVEGKKPLSDELARPDPYERAIPIIEGIEFDYNRKELSVNVPNEGRAVANLPEDAIVEIPVLVNREGVHPISVGPLPEAIAEMCRRQITIQNLLIQAYKERSKELLLQALIIDPVVDSIPRAEKMMEEMLKLQADFLPELK